MEVLTPRVVSAGSVDKSEVHKLLDDRVLLQSAQELDASTLRAHFQLPRNHEKLRFAELVEVQRQAGMVQCHRQLHGLNTAVFVLTSIELSIERTGPAASRPTAGTISARLSMPRDSGSRPREASQRFDLRSRGLVAAGAARVKFVPRAVYSRLPRATPLGRRDIGPAEHFKHELALMPIVDDPLLTDHPSDHVTAMEVVCAVERAMADNLDRNLTSLAINFRAYTHHQDGPLRLRYSLEPGGRFAGVVTQAQMAKATVTGRLDGNSIR